MNPALAKQIEALDEMTLAELREQYAAVFGEESRSTHKTYLRKRIVWGLQMREHGGLSDRARQRAEELANDADLRLVAPTAWTEVRSFKPSESRRPTPGTVLTRPYRGTTVVVNVLASGFEYQGTVYRSLSAVAKAVTGSHWSGNLFFGLAKKGGKR